MSKKKLQQQALASIFRRVDKDDWEVIATEKHEENLILQEKIKNLATNVAYIEIEPKQCRNWKYADRNDFEMGDIEDLAEDIKLNGLLQPVILRRIADPKEFTYEVIAGERRWRACQLANVKLKAIVTDKDDPGCLVIQTSENKKKSLSPYSLSKVYARLMVDLKISQNDLAKKLNIPKSTFGELMSFNKVPEVIWAAVTDLSKVKIKTAAYIAASSNKGEEYVDAIIHYVGQIREGIGADNLDKLVKKHLSNAKGNRNNSISYENKEGVLLFRVTREGRISLSKTIVKKVNLQALAKHLVTFLEVEI